MKTVPEDFKNLRNARLPQQYVCQKLRWVAYILASLGLLLSGTEDSWMIPVGRFIQKATGMSPEFTMVAAYAIPVACFVVAAGFYIASIKKK